MAQTTAKPPAAAAAAAGQPPGSNGAAMRARIEQLEAQIVDMQVIIGTLQSLADKPGAAKPAYGPAPTSRLAGLETQIRALTAQLEGIGREVRRLQKSNGARPPVTSVAGSLPTGADGARLQLRGTPPKPQRTAATARPDPRAPRDITAPQAPRPPAPITGGFATTVTPNSQVRRDPIGNLLRQQPPQADARDRRPAQPLAQRPPQVRPAQPDRQVTALRPPRFDGSGDNSETGKAVFEQAYGYLLQQNYGAAEVGFEDFLKRFPKHPNAASAQYWLGEAHFVRGRYKAAAAAFLKGYRNYPRGPKAADSLLRLAMAWDLLGQKQAACSSFEELENKFPNAKANVKRRADAERRRLRC
ncbi:MAG: tol-pal system protein YbgF [Pseudomonadota bacterium]